MKKYLKYLLLKNKKLFIILIVLFIVVHPLFILNNILGQHLKLFNEMRAHSIIALLIVMFLALIIPVIMQKKQMEIRGTDVLYSLPMKQEKRIYTEIIYGWLLIFIPYIISCLLTTMIIVNYIKTDAVLLCSFFVYYVIIASAWYLFNTFIISKCNSIRDAIIVEGLYLLVLFLLYIQPSNFFTINSISQEVANIMVNKSQILFEFISPINAIIALNYQNAGWMVAIVNIMYCVILLWLIKMSIKRKQAEKSEGISDSRILYPLALFLIIFIMLTSTASNYNDNGIALINCLFLFLCYIIGNFIAQRKFKVKVRHVILFIGSIAFSFVLKSIYIQTGCFEGAYSYQHIKNADKIYVAYSLYETGEDNQYDLSEYNLSGYDDSLDNILNASLKVQDKLVDEYKKRENESSRFISNGYLNVQYFQSKNEEVQVYSYAISYSDAQEIKRVFNEYDLQFHLSNNK